MEIKEPNPVDVRIAAVWLLREVPGLDPVQAMLDAKAALQEAHPRRLVHGAVGYRRGQCRCAVCKAGERLYVATRGDRGQRCGTPGGYEKHVKRGETPCLSCAAAAEAFDSSESVEAVELGAPAVHEWCGTPGGYLRHCRANERSCDRCKAARDEYRASRREAKRLANVEC